MSAEALKQAQAGHQELREEMVVAVSSSSQLNLLQADAHARPAYTISLGPGACLLPGEGPRTTPGFPRFSGRILERAYLATY